MSEAKMSTQKMENGEIRTRVTNDTTSYIIVNVPKGAGGFQNAHWHNYVTEIWIVEKGFQLIVENIDKEMKYHVMKEGDVYISKVGIPHNCYVPEGAVTHTIKLGLKGDDPDWHEAKELDRFTKSLTEEQLNDIINDAIVTQNI